jgi:hypothetical protein
MAVPSVSSGPSVDKGKSLSCWGIAAVAGLKPRGFLLRAFHLGAAFLPDCELEGFLQRS